MAREQWGVVSALRGDERGAQKGRSVNERVEHSQLRSSFSVSSCEPFSGTSTYFSLIAIVRKSRYSVSRTDSSIVSRGGSSRLILRTEEGGGRSALVTQCEARQLDFFY